jgi:SAM-dependent methyltransferase
MGVSAGAVGLLLELRARRLLDDVGSVMEIGAQELHLSADRLREMLAAAGLPYDAERFAGIENWPGRPRARARRLYELLGAREYASIDLNGEEGAIPHDLNLPFDDAAHVGRYDLVTDHGSCEHVFDVAQAYRTVHRLARPNGLILIMQQVTGTNGYFNFDVSFFEDMARSNGYEILHSSFVVTPSGEVDSQFHVPISAPVFDVLDPRRVTTLGAAYVFRKRGDDDFRLGYEGGYAAPAYGYRGFALAFGSEPPSRRYVPVEAGTVATIPARELAQELRRRIARRIRR